MAMTLLNRRFISMRNIAAERDERHAECMKVIGREADLVDQFRREQQDNHFRLQNEAREWKLREEEHQAADRAQTELRAALLAAEAEQAVLLARSQGEAQAGEAEARTAAFANVRHDELVAELSAKWKTEKAMAESKFRDVEADARTRIASEHARLTDELRERDRELAAARDRLRDAARDRRDLEDRLRMTGDRQQRLAEEADRLEEEARRAAVAAAEARESEARTAAEDLFGSSRRAQWGQRSEFDPWAGSKLPKAQSEERDLGPGYEHLDRGWEGFGGASHGKGGGVLGSERSRASGGAIPFSGFGSGGVSFHDSGVLRSELGFGSRMRPDMVLPPNVRATLPGFEIRRARAWSSGPLGSALGEVEALREQG